MYLEQILQKPATDKSVEVYAQGVVLKVMKGATPGIMASLLARIRNDGMLIAELKQRLAALNAPEVRNGDNSPAQL